MSKQQIMKFFKAFQKAPAKGKLRREYFKLFAKKMAYRTTKGEHPEVTKKMVNDVFLKIKS